MSKKRDMVVTLAVGRNYSKRNVPLSPSRWYNFRHKVKKVIGDHAKIVAESGGHGIGSDSTRKGKPESTFLMVAINPVKVPEMRKKMAKILKQYNQHSAALAIDRKHNPIFS